MGLCGVGIGCGYGGGNPIAPAHVSTKSLLFQAGEGVNCGDNYDVERTTPVTFSWWSKTTATSINFFGKHPGGSTGFRALSSGAGAVQFYLQDNFGAQIETGWYSGTADGNWHYYAISYDGSGNNSGLQMYVDSVAGGYHAWGPITGTCVNAANFNIGYTVSYSMVGNIDEFAIYSRVLNLTEIQWIYNLGIPRDLNGVGAPSGLIGYYYCGDEDTYPTILDHGPGGHHGTCFGMEGDEIVEDAPP